METREYVEYLLKNYHQIKKEIRHLMFLLELPIYDSEDDTIEELNFSKQQGEKVMTSGISDKTPKIALIYKEVNKEQRILQRKTMQKIIKVNKLEILKLENSIALLDKNLQYTIKGIYIDKKKRGDICKSLYISENTLNRYRKKGIKEIAIIFEPCTLTI